MRERSRGGRTLRAQKIVKKCPSCPTDICDFLVNPQINREMMALIESLQQKAVEEGVDANECGNDSDLEENDGGLANEDDVSLNEDEKDRAKDRKTKCQVKNSDVNADRSVNTMAEIKEGDQQPNKHNGEPEEEKYAKDKMMSTEVVVALVAEDENKIQKPQKRKGDASIGTDDTKKMKTNASMDETIVCSSTAVQHIKKSGEADV
nr:unnamed protein product [Digitaria exilis]